MEASQTSLLVARGLTDANDRLLSADEPLTDLHECCGGTLGTTLAVPSLLSLVQRARRSGLRIAREFSAFDGEETVRGFVRISPLDDEEGSGCELLIENWQRVPLVEADTGEISVRLDAIDRGSAEITARLDRQQNVQFWNIGAADAVQFKERTDETNGGPWADQVELVGVSHQQPLHWRLLDGAKCRIAGSERSWRVRLLPLGASGEGPRGFELLLIADEPLADGSDTSDDLTPKSGLVGSALTPVLKQPIARIIANAETMRARLAGPLRAEYSEYAGNIVAAGQHLAGMLDDLADLEVVEAAGFSTAREQVDLGDVARRASSILGVRAQDRGIRIETPADTGEGKGGAVIATAEFRRVLQIAINLIGNAIAYSPEQSTVAIAAHGEGETVVLSVKDEGPGVTSEQADRIFEKFERLGRDNDGGSGLGLYISRRLARAMGGDLRVATAMGEGAEFSLILPAASAD